MEYHNTKFYDGCRIKFIFGLNLFSIGDIFNTQILFIKYTYCICFLTVKFQNEDSSFTQIVIP